MYVENIYNNSRDHVEVTAAAVGGYNTVIFRSADWYTDVVCLFNDREEEVYTSSRNRWDYE